MSFMKSFCFLNLGGFSCADEPLIVGDLWLLLGHLQQKAGHLPGGTAFRFFGCVLYIKSPRIGEVIFNWLVSWHILTHLDTFWHILTYLDTSWHVLTYLDRSWHILTRLDTSWHVLTYLDISWHILTYLDTSWPILTDLDTSWHILTRLDTSWHVLTRLDTSWHILTYLDISWHILTYLDISWHILTYLDISWHILTCFQNVSGSRLAVVMDLVDLAPKCPKQTAADLSGLQFCSMGGDSSPASCCTISSHWRVFIWRFETWTNAVDMEES